MAALVFCAFSWVALAPRAQQQKDGLYTASHQQLDVVKIVVAQENAWNSGDLDGFLSPLKDDPETQAMLASPVKGVANIRAAFRINYPNRESMGMVAYSSVEARELGENYALATGKYHLERSRKGGGPADGTFTEVFEKTPQGWKIIFSETT
jgi:ketosteroid isomerase-like protein